MATKEYTRAELEELFYTQYYGKIVTISLPGKERVSGLVDEVAFDQFGELILQVGGMKYECSLAWIKQCIKIIRQ